MSWNGNICLFNVFVKVIVILCLLLLFFLDICFEFFFVIVMLFVGMNLDGVWLIFRISLLGILFLIIVDIILCINNVLILS